ncbi:hypothetical protein D9Q98_004261 [Chlorella vulgaris]|uniref:Uncharacterized protein n=1 Tax=Chlorella vulgaris TaxID=3077 RepID=A0A9D4TRI3_CHLVU|nr:hypothetical protein D9Q98_004261 [Chlorella vulgaris]
MPKKKSLADELADLLNPAPAKEFDPEADVFGAGPTLEESEDEGLAAEAKAGRRGKEGSRMRGEIVMEGKAYAGRRSSRAALFGDDGGSVGGSEEEAEEEQGVAPAAAIPSEGDSGSEEEGEEEGEEEAQGEGWLNGHGGANGGSSSSEDEEGGGEAPEVAAAGSGGRTRRRGAAPLAAADGGAGSSDEEEEEEEEQEEQGEQEEEEQDGLAGGGAAGVVAADEAAELAALEKEYEAMQQDEQTAVAGLRERAGKERKKALAVQAQTSVWQRGLEARILLQRALAGANRLPQGRMQAAAAAADDELAAAFGGLAADASALLADLLSLLRALAAQNPAIADAATAAAGAEEEGSDTPAASKRARHADPAATAAAAAEGEEAGGKAAAAWRQLDEAYAAFAPFRDASIDRWHRKTVLTTGGTALRGGQLRALNQSVSTQVAALMQDPGKVLRRTHVTRAAQQAEQHRVLCPDPDTHQAKRWRGDDGAEESEVNGVDEERDPETFDDSEFYQTLLREFLEASSDVAAAGNWRTGPKQRKAVDRRASKGRRLRYHVHDKLVSFMAPVELDAPQFAPQLFSHLFGGGGAK